MRKFIFIIISISLVIFGLIITYYFFEELSKEYKYDGFGVIEMDATGQVGDYIGGVVGTIFSLAGFIILLLTLNEQAKAAKIERFESKFFELVKFHRDNIQEFDYAVYEKNDLDDSEGTISRVIYEKRKVFRGIFDQFIQCRNETKPFLRGKGLLENAIYTPEYLLKLRTIPEFHGKVNLKLLATIDISYCITFYGLSAEGCLILERIFKGKYNKTLVTTIINYLKLKPTLQEKVLWMKWRALSKKGLENKKLIIDYIYEARKNNKRSLFIPEVFEDNIYDLFNNYHNNFKKFYGGHQFRLGHYYRHLYQTVKFVDRQTGLSKTQKYSYVKILRAQLSTYEQALLFLNSVSSLGLVWEFNPDYSKTFLEFVNISRRRERQLITKYNLIKNLPGESIYGIEIKPFYPNVRYEIDEILNG